jgi:hypothetical protein
VKNNLHVPGAKDDSEKPRISLVLKGFTRALTEVSKVGTYGAEKYTAEGWISVPNGVERYTDAMFRHLFQELEGKTHDKETEMLHAAHTAWNALARLDLMLREHEQEVRVRGLRELRGPDQP